MGMTYDLDLVCKIYVLSNELCVAICKSRFKKYAIPYYLAIGYEPIRGACAKEEWGFETLKEAEKYLKKLFAKGKPQLWINNEFTMDRSTDFNVIHFQKLRTGSWSRYTEILQKRLGSLMKIKMTEPLTEKELDEIKAILNDQ